MAMGKQRRQGKQASMWVALDQGVFTEDREPRGDGRIYFMWYNFGRIHQTLRVTPAMEAGKANHVWSDEEIVSLLEVR
jgi:hypothetical protein